jgi:hypothetical protein
MVEFEATVGFWVRVQYGNGEHDAQRVTVSDDRRALVRGRGCGVIDRSQSDCGVLEPFRAVRISGRPTLAPCIKDLAHSVRGHLVGAEALDGAQFELPESFIYGDGDLMPLA